MKVVRYHESQLPLKKETRRHPETTFEGLKYAMIELDSREELTRTWWHKGLAQYYGDPTEAPLAFHKHKDESIIQGYLAI